MLIELSAPEFKKVRPLFTPIRYHLALDSILAGMTPARIFVDAPEQPALALIWWRAKVFLAGQLEEAAAQASLSSFFQDLLYPQAVEKGVSGYALYFVPGIEQDIDKILRGRNPISRTRHYYHRESTNLGFKLPLGSDYHLLQVNAELLAQDEIENLAFVTEEMESERPSVEDFLEKSFGYCIVKDKRIVACCMSEYNCDKRCELGIMTADGHRRKGLAKVTAGAAIEQASQEGIATVGWHCWADNMPSIATAQSLGFELGVVYPSLYSYFDEQVNLIVNGIVALEGGSTPNALAWFAQAQDLGKIPAWAEEYVVQAQKDRPNKE